MIWLTPALVYKGSADDNPKMINATKMKMEPTKVYKKNLIEAYVRFYPPQIAMRKYMGKSMNSKNKKNKKKSMARKHPMIDAERMRNKK